MSEFYLTIARKIFPDFFSEGVGAYPRGPPSAPSAFRLVHLYAMGV